MLGIASSRRAVAQTVDTLETITRETTGDKDYAVDAAELTVTTGVFPRRELLDREEFQETLGDALGEVEYAYVLYVNGEKVVATTRSGALEDLLEQLKLGYQTSDTVYAYFVEEVDIRQEYVETSYVMNLGYIAEILNETKEGEVTYTVTAGDSYYSIAAKYDMSVDDLMKLNVGYDPKILRVGDVLTISNAVPYLTVVNVERQRYVQDVPYEVEYTDDASMYQGEYKVTSPGVYGKADMTANVTYINGEETEREVVASVTLSQPVTEHQLRGTKERPTWYPTGSFGWPCNGQPVRVSQSEFARCQQLPQGHRHRQPVRHVHLRLRRRHGDVLRLDERLRIPYYHRPWQRVPDVLRAQQQPCGVQGREGPQGPAYRPDGLHRHFQRQPLPLRYQAERHVRQPAELPVRIAARWRLHVNGAESLPFSGGCKSRKT